MNIVACIEAITKTYFFLKRTIIKIRNNKITVKQNTKFKRTKIKQAHQMPLKERDIIQNETKSKKFLETKDTNKSFVSKDVVGIEKFKKVELKIEEKINRCSKVENEFYVLGGILKRELDKIADGLFENGNNIKSTTNRSKVAEKGNKRNNTKSAIKKDKIKEDYNIGVYQREYITDMNRELSNLSSVDQPLLNTLWNKFMISCQYTKTTENGTVNNQPRTRL